MYCIASLIKQYIKRIEKQEEACRSEIEARENEIILLNAESKEKIYELKKK